VIAFFGRLIVPLPQHFVAVSGFRLLALHSHASDVLLSLMEVIPLLPLIAALHCADVVGVIGEQVIVEG
jgi:hypothetical protein